MKSIDLDRKFTLQEYNEELNKPYEVPDPTNCDDPRYFRKYVHTMPPLEAYRMKAPGYNKTNSTKKTNERWEFRGWNNINEFEKQGVA